MTNSWRVFYGLQIALCVFVVSTFLGSVIQLNNEFIPYTFVAHTLMLILSVGLVLVLRKDVGYKISVPKFKRIWKPIVLGIVSTIVVNIFMTIVTVALSSEIESHIAFSVMTPIQVVLFVFIYASVAEELLFRGFLQNILAPLKGKGIKVFRRHISVPVLISAATFGLAHLVLISTGAGTLFLVRIVVFTTVLGTIAGYYQEKYDNNAYAIIVHMAGNSMGLLGALLMSLNPQV